jgi:hypothetical protein
VNELHLVNCNPNYYYFLINQIEVAWVVLKFDHAVQFSTFQYMASMQRMKSREVNVGHEKGASLLKVREAVAESAG